LIKEKLKKAQVTSMRDHINSGGITNERFDIEQKLMRRAKRLNSSGSCTHPNGAWIKSVFSYIKALLEDSKCAHKGLVWTV
jgi:hypothetical protein